MSLPYFPMFPSDFEAKTSHLTLEEDGAYNRLLRICWMTPGCSLPDDHAWIARRMRVDQETFARAVKPVLDEFFQKEKGRVYQAKLRKIYFETAEAHERRVEAGKKGGRKPKLLKNIETDVSNASPLPKQPEPEPEPEPKIKIDDDARAKTPSQPKTFREKILEAINVDPVSGLTGRGGVQLGNQADMFEARRWFSELRLTQDEVFGVIADMMKTKRGVPPNSFRYITKCMESFAAVKAEAAANPLAPSPHATDAPRYRPDMPPKVDVAAVMADIRREREERENARSS
jgi:uncharacterized protein YdaU (DUF1376 family)